MYHNLLKFGVLNPYKRDTGVLKRIQSALLDISNSSSQYSAKARSGQESKNGKSSKAAQSKDLGDPSSKANIRWLVELQNLYTTYQAIANAWEHGRIREAHLKTPEAVEVWGNFAAYFLILTMLNLP